MDYSKITKDLELLEILAECVAKKDFSQAKDLKSLLSEGNSYKVKQIVTESTEQEFESSSSAYQYLIDNILEAIDSMTSYEEVEEEDVVVETADVDLRKKGEELATHWAFGGDHKHVQYVIKSIVAVESDEDRETLLNYVKEFLTLQIGSDVKGYPYQRTAEEHMKLLNKHVQDQSNRFGWGSDTKYPPIKPPMPPEEDEEEDVVVETTSEADLIKNILNASEEPVVEAVEAVEEVETVEAIEVVEATETNDDIDTEPQEVYMLETFTESGVTLDANQILNIDENNITDNGSIQIIIGETTVTIPPNKWSVREA